MKRLKEWIHLLVAAALGAALGIPPAPPLFGYTAAALVAVVLHKSGLLKGGREAVEYVAVLATVWSIAATLLHAP